jgi:hypothetical protein
MRLRLQQMACIRTFAARCGRLQDTLGARVLPAWLAARSERPGLPKPRSASSAGNSRKE